MVTAETLIAWQMICLPKGPHPWVRARPAESHLLCQAETADPAASKGPLCRP